ncbi:hypothetical protein Poli38472_009305 [Pythium oligandrum]|uniref:Uncharacterized protein n=1 Tax=Pythium oligandrum TaxID=41045 RepID=A0A8K1CMQ1_PYTOL|nr:hypothetical protein Poli38472_009305 [Pythium oligandrum]|eukprot:TMW65138.1 hypothetical protein Poli38472_009305 [Pythium oligandrum]
MVRKSQLTVVTPTEAARSPVDVSRAFSEAMLKLGSSETSRSLALVDATASDGGSSARGVKELLSTRGYAVLESRYDVRLHSPSPPPLQCEVPPQRILQMTGLLAFCFFTVCGGPDGSENIVTAGGPLAGLGGMLAVTLVFYLPLAYIVAEVASALPVSGGHAYWVALAFGPGWGFQAGYWSWISNCVDCAMYAAMTVDSFSKSSSTFRNSFVEFLCKSTFALVLALPGLWSLRVVGTILLVMTALMVASYAVVSIWAAAEAEHWSVLGDVRYANSTESPTTSPALVEIDWKRLLSILLWCFGGFFNLSVYAGHIIDPAQSYRRVVWLSTMLILLTYLIPTLTLAAVNEPDWHTWEEGSMNDVIKFVGGKGVVAWMVAVDFIGSAGLYFVSLLTSAYLANGMAKQNLIPASIGLSNAQSSPRWAIAGSLVVILIMVNLEYDAMLPVANTLAGLEVIALIAASIRLRWVLPNLPRPVKFWGNAPVVFPAISLIVPMVAYGFAVIDAFRALNSGVVAAALLVIGVIYGCRADFSSFQQTADAIEALEETV